MNYLQKIISRLAYTSFVLAILFQTGNSQTRLQGIVSFAIDSTPVPFATVALFKDNHLITGADTDFDGLYFFNDLAPGLYDLEVSFLGYTTHKVTGVIVPKDQLTKLDMQLEKSDENMDNITIMAYRPPIVRACPTTQGRKLTAEDIKNLPVKNLNEIDTTRSRQSASNHSDVSIGPGRAAGIVYYIDGIKVDVKNMDASINQSLKSEKRQRILNRKIKRYVKRKKRKQEREQNLNKEN